MKMKNTDQFLNDDEGDETIIAPRFDDEETVLARPVVPLEEVGDAPAARSASTPSAAPAPPYSRLRVAPRRSLVAVLVLVSALVGSALGVGGLYLYQQRRGTDANAAQQQAEAPAAQPTVQPATESRQQEASAPAQSSTPAPVAPEPDAQASEVSDSSKEAEREEPGGDAAAERRNDDDDDSARATKRGKKGARDEEPQRGAQRAPRYDEDTRPVVRDNDDDDTREARRVGVITYRPRRVRSPRRGPYYDSPDRLRRIFEGQP
jgi:hypothetical protein